jgi:hypothetical protein
MIPVHCRSIRGENRVFEKIFVGSGEWTELLLKSAVLPSNIPETNEGEL